MHQNMIFPVGNNLEVVSLTCKRRSPSSGTAWIPSGFARVSAIAIGFLLSGCFPLGDAWVGAAGIVKSEDGHPLEGVKVILIKDTGEDLYELDESYTHDNASGTEHHGSYRVHKGLKPTTNPPRFYVEVRLDGYETVRKEVQYNQVLDVDFVLKRLDN